MDALKEGYIKNSENKLFSNISFVEGDIFQSKMQTLVNPVNCRGVMGAGLALLFKKKFPKMFEDYVNACKSGKLKVGRPILWKGERWILNFPTKDDWRQPSKLEWIEQGLVYFVKNYHRAGITSIAFPCLGCNLGGLLWFDVRDLMIKYLSKVSIPVEIFLPKLSKTERNLVSLVDLILQNSELKVEEIHILRSLFPQSDLWTDLKKAPKCKVQIIIDSNNLDGFLDFLTKIIKSIDNNIAIIKSTFISQSSQLVVIEL
ncbi:MAG: macro domain-containing protein [Ignavibacteria bacterium]|nr:macro domain-containing protein [Ignavibacteria bacterium]